MRSNRSKKAVVYGIQALRLYQQTNKGLMSEEVAQQLDISPDYAAKVNRLLIAAGFIKGARDRTGYKLVKDLKKTSIAEMMRGIDKSINRILDDDPGDTDDMLAIRKRLRDTLVSGGWGKPVSSLL